MMQLFHTAGKVLKLVHQDGFGFMALHMSSSVPGCIHSSLSENIRKIADARKMLTFLYKCPKCTVGKR